MATDKINICHRVEDSQTPQQLEQTVCSECGKAVYREVPQTGTAVCMQCAPANAVVFVELPPDEFGRRSMAKSVEEVRTKDGGNWHKGGNWHDAENALFNNVE